jgi:hypothetical protein
MGAYASRMRATAPASICQLSVSALSCRRPARLCPDNRARRVFYDTPPYATKPPRPAKR